GGADRRLDLRDHGVGGQELWTTLGNCRRRRVHGVVRSAVRGPCRLSRGRVRGTAAGTGRCRLRRTTLDGGDRMVVAAGVREGGPGSDRGGDRRGALARGG